MPSIVPGFEYDIFISYRHNDNLDGWVTDFVQTLEKELKATIKEPLSVYFDKNPHDGLLETHNVDKSLEGKLKSLIFIPIISQTYCDSKSFAWQNEFRAFNALANEDSFGRDITLGNGNVASRILPIKIHDLDAEDRCSIENEIGGILRSIEFIYKEPGVNRPLKSTDQKIENQNKTDYRNQLNKTAYAIKDVLTSLKAPSSVFQSINLKTRTAIETQVGGKKSIVVLPFVNISNDPDQEYFSDGLTEEIISDLSQVNDLTVISRSSAMTFKGTSKLITEIAGNLNVRYVLEGSVRKSGNSLRITAQLIDSVDDSHVWAHKYNGELERVFDLQEKISRSIVEALKIKLTEEESNKIAEKPLKNAMAYELCQRAMHEVVMTRDDSMKRALALLDEALGIEGENTFLLTKKGFVYCNLFNAAGSSTGDRIYLDEAKTYASRILALEGKSAQWHSLFAFITFYEGRTTDVARHLRLARQANPKDHDQLWLLVLAYMYLGMTPEAMETADEFGRYDPLNPILPLLRCLVYYGNGDIDQCQALLRFCYKKYREIPQVQLYYAYFKLAENNQEEALAVLRSFVTDFRGTVFEPMGLLFIASIDKANEKAPLLPEDAVEKIKLDCEWSWLVADFYSLAGQPAESLRWLEHTVDHGFVNYPLLAMHDFLLENVRKEPEFPVILAKAKKVADAAAEEFRSHK